MGNLSLDSVNTVCSVTFLQTCSVVMFYLVSFLHRYFRCCQSVKTSLASLKSAKMFRYSHIVCVSIFPKTSVYLFYRPYSFPRCRSSVMRLNTWAGLNVSLSLRVFSLTFSCYFLFSLFLSVSPSFLSRTPPRPAVILSMGVQG